ncbi:MAG: GtrA family protein [Caulobacteraceae bacterium]|nr:GtrA family protein [Caulobacteraceae bacterium]
MISSQTAARFRRYILTGATAAVVDVTIFNALHAGTGMSIVLAATCSFCVAAVVNYTLCSMFVFGHALSLRQLARFFGIAVVGMTVNVGVTGVADALAPFAAMVAWVADLIGLPPSLLTPYAPDLGKICGIGVAFLFNFYMNNTVVFRERAEPVRARSGVA